MHGKDLARVFGPGGDGECIVREIKEADTPVSAGREELVLVGFGPAGVKEGVFGVVPFLGNDALRSEIEDEESAVAY